MVRSISWIEASNGGGVNTGTKLHVYPEKCEAID
jgi:hypothetical protein